MARHKRKGSHSYVVYTTLDQQAWKFRPRWWDVDRVREAQVTARLSRRWFR